MWSSIRNWIEPFLPFYNESGIDVSIICNMDSSFKNYLNEKYPYIHTISLPFPRGVSILGSLKSIHLLKNIFKNEKFDLVQYSTPNASFYAAIAAKKAKIKRRLYCQWGMVFISQKGIKRLVFKIIEKIICKKSTFVQPDSFGNLEYCRKNGFYTEEKSCVIWNGSAKGLDLEKYDLLNKNIFNEEIRNKYNIPDSAIVLGFVGRLGQEKGCNELFSVFQKIRQKYNNVKLLFVGPIEKENTIKPELLHYFKTCEDIIITDRVTEVEKYFSAMDIFVLPSYREGFGMSVIEASSLKIPVICTKYPGPSSAVIDGKTGLLIEPRNIDQLFNAICLLIDDATQRTKLGQNGRKFVETHFEQKKFISLLIANRLKMLNE